MKFFMLQFFLKNQNNLNFGLTHNQNQEMNSSVTEKIQNTKTSILTF